MDVIPIIGFPQSENGHAFIDEPLVSIKEYFKGKILVEPVYHKQGYSGTTDDCYVRLSVAKNLGLAVAYLPSGLTFKVFDGWRSVETQTSLYNKYYSSVKKEHPTFTEEALMEETRKFVSIPSLNPDKPSAHNTGGAIDLTIFDVVRNIDLDMGTAFDDFTPKAYTHSFEEYDSDEEWVLQVRNNRRLLYYCMQKAGFTNLPTEWWHYDYGDAFWSYYCGKPTLYKGLINTMDT